MMCDCDLYDKVCGRYHTLVILCGYHNSYIITS